MEVTGNLSDFYGQTMLPALEAVVDRGFKAFPVQYTQIFNVRTSNRSIEQSSQVSGVGRFLPLAEGEAVRRDQPVQGFKQTFVHTRWGLSVPVTVDVVEDDKWDLIGNMHKDLGWSCQETQELDAVSTFNNGFDPTYPGPDGVALFSASHPLYKAGGTQSNVLTTAADLDMMPLQQMLTQFRLQKRASGEYIHLPARNLVIHPNNVWIAHALTRSGDDPTTSDRSTNPLGAALDGMPKPFAWNYLTDADAWFITAPPEQTELIWYWRKKPYTKSWTDDDTEVGVTAMRYKKSHGWRSFYGVMGTPGV
jgi:hypothetical protein